MPIGIPLKAPPTHMGMPDDVLAQADGPDGDALELIDLEDDGLMEYEPRSAQMES